MKEMTIPQACLKALEDIGGLAKHTDVLTTIQEKNYYDFGQAKTPDQTISATLGNFIRKGDTRVKRIKNDKGTYSYYLTKYEDAIFTDHQSSAIFQNSDIHFHERDLHPLLSTYAFSKNIYTKTIYHEKSNREDKEQKWIHPDMIGVEFLPLKTKEVQKLLRSVNGSEMFRIYSYELKKEIQTDSDLKMSYFQAVSNSSWANYGYLVTLEINSRLMTEMERLTKSFGIGIIELKSNPYESKILFPAQFNELDMQTIDKLALVNDDFREYMALIEEALTTEEKNQKRIIRDIEEVNEITLQNDIDIKEYCEKHHIPYEYTDDKEK